MNEKLKTLIAEAEAMNKLEMSAEELTAFDAKMLEIASVKASIEREKKMLELKNTIVTPEPKLTVIKDEADAKFSSVGEMVKSIITFKRSGRKDIRLTRFDQVEGTDANGGFLLDNELSINLFSLASAPSAFYPDAMKINLTPRRNKNGVRIPAIAVSNANGASGGLTVGIVPEGTDFSISTVLLNSQEMKLSKFGTAISLSSEFVEDDAGELDAFITSEYPKAAGLALDSNIVNGAGTSGAFVGFKASAATTGLISVAVTNATSGVVAVADILSIVSKIASEAFMVGKWYMPLSVYTQLPLLTIGDRPVFLGQTGLADAPYGVLYGRPIVITDAVTTLTFASMPYYAVAVMGGVKKEISVDADFLGDNVLIKFKQRAIGTPRALTSMTNKAAFAWLTS